jgi:hypothetical protein
MELDENTLEEPKLNEPELNQCELTEPKLDEPKLEAPKRAKLTMVGVDTFVAFKNAGERVWKVTAVKHNLDGHKCLVKLHPMTGIPREPHALGRGRAR